MLGDIDYNKKPIQPQYFLCKPNREPIGKLSEIFNDDLSVKLNDISELSFSLPYFIDKNHKHQRNKNSDLIRERYLIKTVTDSKKEWYMVNSIEDSIDDKDVMNVKCYSTARSLTDKLIKSYSVESYHAEKVLNDLLRLGDTIWNIDYLDADFKLSYRAFDFPSTNVLEAIFSVAETYNAIVHFDTDKRLISMTKPELTGNNRGFTVSHGKLMKNMSRNTSSEEMVTRLSASGKDGLGIQKVNPTGQNYIESYAYWRYPFERDTNRNVISSSLWMSDSLCHALLDYDLLVESKTGLFKQYLEEQEKYEKELNLLKVDLNKLKNDESVLEEVELAQQFGDKMFFEKYSHSGSSSRTFKLNKDYAYAVMIKVDNGSGVSLNLNGSMKSITSGQWVMLDKIKSLELVSLNINGGSTGVFMQIATISLDEYSSVGNNNAIVERYSLNNKKNQINLKQIEISNKLNSISNVVNRTKSLQKTLDSENNFTTEHLQELNEFVIERDFSDDMYIDEKDLYEATLEKFKELQIPQLAVQVDIVNFLEIIEEQSNWKKLNLGDFVNIKYEPLNISIVARISEINYDYSGSSISITLSNAKNVNDESTRMEKFIGNTANTSITVDVNKTKWGKAVVDVSDMSRLFDNFWNKVTNEINMSVNNTVEINNKGITIIDPNDPLRFLRLTNGAVGLTRSGGLRYETAISADGLIAEMVLGKIILGQRVVIGDTTGVFTIEGSKLMIDDRCGRQVARLGLLSENPDKFGFTLNRYASTSCSDTTIVNRVKMTADEGFTIERVRNGISEKTFGTSLDGDLYVKAGKDDQVFTIDKNGLALGSSIWSQAPFHADYFGNVWMNKLYADTADIKNSTFNNGHIFGSDITLGTHPNIIKLFPNIGLWAGHEDFDKAPFSVDMLGNMKAHKAQLIGKAGEILIDTDKGFIDMDKFDIINVGKLVAEMLQVNTILADKSYVNDLTVNKLKTLPKDVNVGAYVDYIEIQDKHIDFITAQVGSKNQASDSRGRLLFWDNSEKKILTTENTGIIAYAYLFSNIKIKSRMTFEGSGDSANPIRTIGLGDGTPKGGKAIETKYNGGYKLSYGTSNTGNDRSIDFSDEGVFINSQGREVKITTKDVNIVSDGGTIKVSNTGGASVELKPDGSVLVSGNKYDFA